VWTKDNISVCGLLSPAPPSDTAHSCSSTAVTKFNRQHVLLNDIGLLSLKTRIPIARQMKKSYRDFKKTGINTVQKRKVRRYLDTSWKNGVARRYWRHDVGQNNKITKASAKMFSDITSKDNIFCHFEERCTRGTVADRMMSIKDIYCLKQRGLETCMDPENRGSTFAVVLRLCCYLQHCYRGLPQCDRIR